MKTDRKQKLYYLIEGNKDQIFANIVIDGSEENRLLLAETLRNLEYINFEVIHKKDDSSKNKGYQIRDTVTGETVFIKREPTIKKNPLKYNIIVSILYGLDIGTKMSIAEDKNGDFIVLGKDIEYSRNDKRKISDYSETLTSPLTAHSREFATLLNIYDVTFNQRIIKKPNGKQNVKIFDFDVEEIYPENPLPIPEGNRFFTQFSSNKISAQGNFIPPMYRSKNIPGASLAQVVEYSFKNNIKRYCEENNVTISDQQIQRIWGQEITCSPELKRKMIILQKESDDLKVTSQKFYKSLFEMDNNDIQQVLINKVMTTTEITEDDYKDITKEDFEIIETFLNAHNTWLKKAKEIESLEKENIEKTILKILSLSDVPKDVVSNLVESFEYKEKVLKPNLIINRERY